MAAVMVSLRTQDHAPEGHGQRESAMDTLMVISSPRQGLAVVWTATERSTCEDIRVVGDTVREPGGIVWINGCLGSPLLSSFTQIHVCKNFPPKIHNP